MKQYHLPYDIEAVGKNIKEGNFWGKNMTLKMGVDMDMDMTIGSDSPLVSGDWGRKSSCMELYTPLNKMQITERSVKASPLKLLPTLLFVSTAAF